MKKILTFGIAALAAGTALAASSIPSRVYEARLATAISDNGHWLCGQTTVEGTVFLTDMVNNTTKSYQSPGVEGTGYTMGVGKTVSNDGTMISLLNGIPYVLQDGKWSKLPGNAVDGSAALGSISTDGSMILGMYGEIGTTTEDIQMGHPAIWYRNEDGTYGNPVLLPETGKDFFGLVPQYLNLIGISEDKKVISALMTDWSGFFEIPFIYTQDADGNWTYRELGRDLLIPDGRAVPEFPGDYSGPAQPDAFSYLSEAEETRFKNSIGAWDAQQRAKGLTDEEIQILQITYVAEFMSGTKKEEYLKLAEAFLAAYVPWIEKCNAYTEFLEYIHTNGLTFLMNNAFVSPDGKYAYFTAIKTVVIDPTDPEQGVLTLHAPVRFDVSTGEVLVYSFDQNVVIGSIAADGSIFGKPYEPDASMYTDGYIYPQGKEEPMTVEDYMLEIGNKEAFTWMEDNMLHEVIIGVNANGTYQVDDRFCTGMPLTTPDMDLIAFTTPSSYWTDNYSSYEYMTYVLNTGMDTGVESITADAADASIEILPGACVEVKGNVKSLDIYDLSGLNVYNVTNPSGQVSTGLASGVYLVRAITADGTVLTRKALF